MGEGGTAVEDDKVQPQQGEVPFGRGPLVRDIPFACCPICGQAVVDRREREVEEMTPCSHLAFIFLGDRGEYAFMTESYRDRLGSSCIELDTLEPTQGLLGAMGYGDELVTLQVEYGDKVRGGSTFSDMLAFDNSAS